MNSKRLKELWYRHRLLVAGAVVIMTVATGTVTSRMQGEPLVLDAIASPTPGADADKTKDIVVDVQGAVAKPGVRHLPAGSLVANAIKAAGGFTQDADRPRIARELNQAEELKDHQKVYIPLLGDLAASTPAPSAGVSGSTGVPGIAGPVNLNTATLEELDTLPGIGESTAQSIIDYREAFGPFESVEELLEVSGIGEAKLEKLIERVTV